MSKSCLNCINYISSVDSHVQRSTYGGKPTDLGTCRVKGFIIEAPETMSTDDVNERAEALAETCDAYQSGGLSTKVTLRIGVGAPPAPAKTTGPAKNCRACHYFVPPARVHERINVAMGACAKFGQLVPDLKSAEVAKNCGASQRVEAVTDVDAHHKALLDSILLDPDLERYLTPHDTRVAAGDRIDTSIEPSTYPTDKPVTPAQEKAGVRAWRKITDGKRELYLPIFRRDFFDPIEQAKIPNTGDDEHPEEYVDHMALTFTVAALWFHLDETPELNGKAGTGKTEFFRYMAWLMQIPFERISITADSNIDDIAGKMHFENNHTQFKYGRIPKAWQKPGVIVLDEPNTGPPEVWQFIRPLTDNSKQLVLDQNEGETIKRSPFTFLGMAMNPSWDPLNVGAEQIGDADGGRLMHIYVDLPDRPTEIGIIRKRCNLDGFMIEDSVLDKVMDVAATLRDMSDNGELPLSWGIRNQIKVARAMAWFDVIRAYRLAVLDYLEPETRVMVEEVVNAHFGKGGKR